VQRPCSHAATPPLRRPAAQPLRRGWEGVVTASPGAILHFTLYNCAPFSAALLALVVVRRTGVQGKARAAPARGPLREAPCARRAVGAVPAHTQRCPPVPGGLPSRRAPSRRAPEQEDSEQEDSEQEGSEQEGSEQEGSEQEGSEQEDSEQEGSEQEDSEQEDSEQEGSEQEDSEQEDSRAGGLRAGGLRAGTQSAAPW